MRSAVAVSFWGSLLSSTSLAQGTKTSKYTDKATGIDFLGFADGTGYQFGMALPQDPSTDLIIQLISPLSNGGGWGGVDFGESMTGHLMIATWPNNGKVLISPRIATGYEIDDGANAYTQQAVSLTPISQGTFVNTTHVSATFVCAGCINGDSFKAADSEQTFSYAYAKLPVADPSNVGTALSDHTTKGEPYGPFTVTLSDAKSGSFEEWAKLASSSSTGGSEGNSTSGNTTSSAGPSASDLEGGSSGSGSSSSFGSSNSPTTSLTSVVDITGMGGGFWMLMAMIVLVYVVQPFLS